MNTKSVTLYLRRETIDNGYYTDIAFRIGMNLKPTNMKRANVVGRYLWQSLGLPDEDGEHRVKVVLDE